ATNIRWTFFAICSPRPGFRAPAPGRIRRTGLPWCTPSLEGTTCMHALATRFLAIRRRSAALADPLSAEDCAAQSMPDASPAKWHLAHTTWFFEQFVLARAPAYRTFDPRFSYLFNSYYESVGPRQGRGVRGLLTRPSLDDVLAYRRHVDAAMAEALAGGMDA